MLGKYSIGVTKADLLGQGASSLCFRARHVHSGAMVAVKISKVGAGPAVVLKKFHRQLSTILELQKPVAKPSDPLLWHEELAKAKPADLFVRLLDFSRTAQGDPGHDPCDGGLYIVTDLARESLEDYLCRMREPTEDFVRGAAKAVTTAVAVLHSKGLVHLDVKPSNLLLFGQQLKLIDVDGCSPAGTSLSSHDRSTSVSFAYCAPEVARWLAPPGERPTTEERCLEARPALDVWSVALVACELVTAEAALARAFGGSRLSAERPSPAARPTTGSDEVRYLHWLGTLEKPPVPNEVKEFDSNLHALVTEALNPDETLRGSLAQQLSQRYFAGSGDPAQLLHSWSEDAAVTSTGMGKLSSMHVATVNEDVVDLAPVQFMVPTSAFVRDLTAPSLSTRRTA